MNTTPRPDAAEDIPAGRPTRKGQVLRLYDPEREAVRRAAAQAGLPINEYIRGAVLARLRVDGFTV